MTELRERFEESAKEYETKALYSDEIILCRAGEIVNKKRLAFSAGAEFGYNEAIADVLKLLDKERHDLVMKLEDFSEENTPGHFAFYQRHFCIEKIINIISKINKNG